MSGATAAGGTAAGALKSPTGVARKSPAGGARKPPAGGRKPPAGGRKSPGSTIGAAGGKNFKTTGLPPLLGDIDLGDINNVSAIEEEDGDLDEFGDSRNRYEDDEEEDEE